MGYKNMEKILEEEKTDKENVRDIEAIVNDFQEQLGTSTKKADHNGEENGDTYYIDNSSIDIEGKLADLNEKILSTFSNRIDELFEQFKSSINENSFSNELNELGDYIKKEINEKNKEFDTKIQEIDAKNKKIEEEQIEKMVSSLLVWKNRKDAEFIQKQRNLQEEFDQKHIDLGKKLLEFDQSTKEFKDKKEKEEKELDQTIKEFNDKKEKEEKDLLQRQTEFQEKKKKFDQQVTIFEKEKNSFNRKKNMAAIFIIVVFFIVVLFLIIKGKI